MPSPPSPDTTPDAAEFQFAAWRALSAAEKLELVRGLSRSVLALERAGLERRHPDFGPDELHWASVARRLGPELAARVRAAGKA